MYAINMPSWKNQGKKNHHLHNSPSNLLGVSPEQPQVLMSGDFFEVQKKRFQKPMTDPWDERYNLPTWMVDSLMVNVGKKNQSHG